jgi:hypothetical protein
VVLVEGEKDQLDEFVEVIKAEKPENAVVEVLIVVLRA